MALKKSQLYSSLWKSCDQLRGGMDASQYKDYVLTLLFVKYVSDKHAADPYALIRVPAGAGFADMEKLAGGKEIGDKINKIIGRLAEANDLKRVIDQADFNDEAKLGRGKEMQDRLSKLVGIFSGLDFRANRADGDDLLGDAYEYLMRHFATESGKSKGQFYTPAEVSKIMAKVIGIGADTTQDQSVYDPACGSGSLLLKAADQAPRGLTIYGQEKDNATWALARMNLILHGHAAADLWHGNTLASPRFTNEHGGLKTFDFAVANPPFSDDAWMNGVDPENDEFRRFEYGLPPAGNGDYAFLLHFVASLKSAGRGAIILPHGVLFRGNREAGIRKELVQRGFVEGVIGLPPNLFYGTGIPACILVIDKGNAAARAGIFMIDASRGFRKDGAKNRLRAQDIHRIVDVFNARREVPGYSRMVLRAEIAGSGNDYNLNIPRYIDSSEPEDQHDLSAHLLGGIPDRDIDSLEDFWAEFPSLRAALFKANGRDGYSDARMASSDLRGAVLGHADFGSYKDRVSAALGEWWADRLPSLLKVGEAGGPKEVIEDLSESLLASFAELAPLLDRYDVYQRLMDYWDDEMHDDVYAVSADGWARAAQPRQIAGGKKSGSKETPDLAVGRQKWKMDLLPPALVVSRYFADDEAGLEELRSEKESAEAELKAFEEEHGGEDGLLRGTVNDKGNRTKTAAKARLRLLADDPGSQEETDAIEVWLALSDDVGAAKREFAKASKALNTTVLARYGELTEAEIREVVVRDKWRARIRATVEDEVRRVIGRLASRVSELEERYAKPLPKLEDEVAVLSAKVDRHLERMGAG